MAARLPEPTTQDCADCRLRDAELCGEFLLGRACSRPVVVLPAAVSRPDRGDFGFGQDSAGMRFAFTSVPRVPSLGHHIRAVVGGGANEKVIGAHAGSVVAMMKDEQPKRNSAEVQFPGHAVRRRRSPARRIADHSVTRLGIYGAGPDPAAACLSDFCPEANGEGWQRGRIRVHQILQSGAKPPDAPTPRGHLTTSILSSLP